MDSNCPKSLIVSNFPITSLNHINGLVNNGDGCTMVAVGIKDYGLTILGGTSHNLINSSCVIPICLIIFFKRGMPISLPPCGLGIKILCFSLIMY